MYAMVNACFFASARTPTVCSCTVDVAITLVCCVHLQDVSTPFAPVLQSHSHAMHHGSTAADGQLVFFMTNRLNNHAYGTHHDSEKAYLPEQRMQVDSVDSPFDCGFVDVKVPAVSNPVRSDSSVACMCVSPEGASQLGASNCMNPPYLPGQPCHGWRHPALPTPLTRRVSR